MVQLDVSLLAGLLAEQLLRSLRPAISREALLLQLGRGGGRGGDQIQPLHDQARADALPRARLPRPHLGALSTERRGASSRTASARCCPSASGPVRRSRRAREGAARIATSRPSSFEPIQGKGVNIPADDYLPEAARALPQVRHAARCGRGPDRPRPHRKVLRRRALGRRAGHDLHGEGALRRLRARRRGRVRKHVIDAVFRPHGSRGGARVDLLEEQPRDGRRPRDAAR